MLLISSKSLEEAVKASIFGKELSGKVICISEKEESVFRNIIDEIEGLN